MEILCNGSAPAVAHSPVAARRKEEGKETDDCDGRQYSWDRLLVGRQAHQAGGIVCRSSSTFCWHIDRMLKRNQQFD